MSSDLVPRFGRRSAPPPTATSAPPPRLTPQEPAPPGDATLRGMLVKSGPALDPVAEAALAQRLMPAIADRFGPQSLELFDRADLARRIATTLSPLLPQAGILVEPAAVERIAERMVALLAQQAAQAGAAAQGADPAVDQGELQALTRARLGETLTRVLPALFERIDPAAAAQLSRAQLAEQITPIIPDILTEQKLRLNGSEQRALAEMLLDEMMGLGPLEPLMADDTVTDILVNGAFQIYVERKGKLVVSEAKFRDNQHVLNIAQRIVSRIGRRVDESTPLCDARLEDGSRVNVIIPPLAIDGPSISIRKFSKKKITLDVMARQGNISPAMATVLKIAARSRLNIVISGGTGSGKTTLLNALSQLIDAQERIVTIEDAAELQLQQPHVVRLETRPPNLEGEGQITMRDLLKNSLRMRPDRIIMGEVRGFEAFDMLQAMNTGHDGSLCTIHANGPREALARLENMVMMAGLNLPARAIRSLVSSAVDIIVQISRMRDGMRRITSVTEVVGMEEEIITIQELFAFDFKEASTDGRILGDFRSSGLRPHFLPKAAYFGLDKALLDAML